MTNNRDAFEYLINERTEHPERNTEIDKQIWNDFGRKCAVWVLDLSGFSRMTMRCGIIHFLVMIHRLQKIALPIIIAEGGAVVKTEADNVFATFDDVAPAVKAAKRLQDELAKANEFLPEDWDMYVSIGIGYGDILMAGDNDFYGSEVNYASKLGEDIANPGEIFLTELARARLDDSVASERREFDISGIKIISYLLS